SRLPWRVAPTAHAHYRAVETYTPQKNLRRRLERRARQGGTGMLAIALRLASGALLSTIFAAGAAAHHAFSTEFDAELTCESRGKTAPPRCGSSPRRETCRPIGAKGGIATRSNRAISCARAAISAATVRSVFTRPASSSRADRRRAGGSAARTRRGPRPR